MQISLPARRIASACGADLKLGAWDRNRTGTPAIHESGGF